MTPVEMILESKGEVGELQCKDRNQFLWEKSDDGFIWHMTITQNHSVTLEVLFQLRYRLKGKIFAVILNAERKK